jgi:hypothetical protein
MVKEDEILLSLKRQDAESRGETWSEEDERNKSRIQMSKKIGKINVSLLALKHDSSQHV